MKYDFDKVIDRRGTHSVKIDCLPEGASEDSLILSIADMDFACAEPIIKALHERVDHGIFGYTSYDSPELKDAVYSWFKRRYEWEIDKSHMFFCPGIVPALGFLINALTEEGDGIIIQRPVYALFTAKVEGHKRVVVNSPLIRQGNTYVMDFDDLEKKFADPKNKGMLLCNPHNPVGRVWTEEELHKLVGIAKKYDKWIIADEIHGDLTRMGISYNPLLKVASEYEDRLIICTAPSKTFNLAGTQFSNIIIPNPEYQKLWNEFIDDKYSLINCTPFGLSAIIAAYNESEEWVEQVREYIDKNIEYVNEFVKEHLPKAEVIESEATYLVWIDVHKYCAEPKKLEQAMLQAKLVLDEGYVFGEEGVGYERINVAVPKSVVAECMERMKTGLESLE